MIDLCYILLQYCARKTKELASQDEEDGLGLKKMYSVVDEMSMSTILNQNFTFLIGLLKEDMQVFETIYDHLTKKEYDVLINHTISDRNEKTMIDAVVARVTDKYSKVELAELPENDRKAIEETIKQASSKLSSYYESTKGKVNRCGEEIQKILSIFYFYVYGTPDMATLFFDHKQNLEPVLKLYLGNYPDKIALFATKIVESLSIFMSTDVIMSDIACASDLLDVTK